MLPENRLALVKASAHAGILAPATREHEHDRGSDVRRAMRKDTPRIESREQLKSLFAILRH